MTYSKNQYHKSPQMILMRWEFLELSTARQKADILCIIRLKIHEKSPSVTLHEMINAII